MRKNSNSPRAGSQGKGSSSTSSMVAAVLVGMVLGLALAGGVAWYILGRPSPFQQSAQRDEVKLEPIPAKPAAQAAPAGASAVAAATATTTAASGVDEGKPRFEFYKVLTDKQDSSGSPAPAAKAPAKAAPAIAAKDKGPFYLQAGAFANADDADKLKAKLAMMGVEASIQAATLPDKSVWHRVRLGPYKTAEEMNKAVAQLKQNGVSATASHAQ